ncbi:MAG: hypothetical protein LBG21_02575 [Campylobacteraceae bacterium]|jgi:hypothetical protein|nr:hypothetical protein [Campylobacteraceae bacterium]
MGNINGSQNIGGIAGTFHNTTITNSYSRGNISGNYDIGGIVGIISYGSIVNSYSTGNINGNKRVGGIAGGSYGSFIRNNVAINPSIIGIYYVNSVVGYNSDSTVLDNFVLSTMLTTNTPGGNTGMFKSDMELK